MTSDAKPPWDFTPDHELLDPVERPFDSPLTFEASLNAHGMYETMRFVLRLSPRNHELVDSIGSGRHKVGDISPQALQAYATYIHETVHWWQHVGSTSGLVFSLCYLAQSHSSLGQLREVFATFGPKKSLKRWTDETLLKEGHSAQGRLAAANTAVNNALDVEYYKLYAMRPKQSALWLYDQTHFESIGHSYHIVYGQLIGMVSGSIDPEMVAIPNGKAWDDEFRRLTEAKHEGFYWGSPMRVPPVGLHGIYEGQARFTQLQFLNAIRERSPSCQEWRDLGFLDGIYVEAFELFLELSESQWPDTLDDPLIGLFLLICDLAINPTRGFPVDIEIFEDFIRDVDVGVRFSLLSQAVRELPHLRSAIKEYSRDEYIAVAEELTNLCGYDHPLSALEKLNEWNETAPGLAALMEEQKTFEFDLTNLPIRVFLSHFIALSRDKLTSPEFFCWPGVWLVGARADADVQALWLRHLSLFSDRGDKPGIYPRSWPDRDPKAVKLTFDRFYGSMALYELTRQWILKDGPFVCDFEWLWEDYSQVTADAWGNDTFQKVYGVSLDDFEIVG